MTTWSRSYTDPDRHVTRSLYDSQQRTAALMTELPNQLKPGGQRGTRYYVYIAATDSSAASFRYFNSRPAAKRWAESIVAGR